MTSDDAEGRRNVRRTTIIMTCIALAFYLGFILMGVMNS
jgi:uncharacterized membrane protein (DUF485 family)